MQFTQPLTINCQLIGSQSMNTNPILRKSLIVIAIAILPALCVNRQLSAQAPKVSGERYYMLVFAAQAEPNVVRRSHSFALFVRASEVGKEANRPELEVHSISWMPKSMIIQPLHMIPEPGVNLDLNSTLDWARSVHARVSMWGPFPIRKELYEKAVARQKKLESGVIEYLCMDRRYRGELATNCIHAISDLDRNSTSLDTGVACGKAASEQLVEYFRPQMTSNTGPTDWLVDQLGLRSREIQFESGLGDSKIGRSANKPEGVLGLVRDVERGILRRR